MTNKTAQLIREHLEVNRPYLLLGGDVSFASSDNETGVIVDPAKLGEFMTALNTLLIDLLHQQKNGTYREIFLDLHKVKAETVDTKKAHLLLI
jgi:hypothetical protein